MSERLKKLQECFFLLQICLFKNNIWNKVPTFFHTYQNLILIILASIPALPTNAKNTFFNENKIKYSEKKSIGRARLYMYIVAYGNMQTHYQLLTDVEIGVSEMIG